MLDYREKAINKAALEIMLWTLQHNGQCFIADHERICNKYNAPTGEVSKKIIELRARKQFNRPLRAKE